MRAESAGERPETLPPLKCAAAEFFVERGGYWVVLALVKGMGAFIGHEVKYEPSIARCTSEATMSICVSASSSSTPARSSLFKLRLSCTGRLM